MIFLVLSAYKADHFCCTDCIVLQHDAACRVIARLKKERDEARMLLAQAERQIPLLAASAANATTAVSNGKRGLVIVKFTMNFFNYIKGFDFIL